MKITISTIFIIAGLFSLFLLYDIAVYANISSLRQTSSPKIAQYDDFYFLIHSEEEKALYKYDHDADNIVFHDMDNLPTLVNKKSNLVTMIGSENTKKTRKRNIQYHLNNYDYPDKLSEPILWPDFVWGFKKHTKSLIPNLDHLGILLLEKSKMHCFIDSPTSFRYSPGLPTRNTVELEFNTLFDYDFINRFNHSAETGIHSYMDYVDKNLVDDNGEVPIITMDDYPLVFIVFNLQQEDNDGLADSFGRNEIVIELSHMSHMIENMCHDWEDPETYERCLHLTHVFYYFKNILKCPPITKLVLFSKEISLNHFFIHNIIEKHKVTRV